SPPVEAERWRRSVVCGRVPFSSGARRELACVPSPSLLLLNRRGGPPLEDLSTQHTETRVSVESVQCGSNIPSKRRRTFRCASYRLRCGLPAGPCQAGPLWDQVRRFVTRRRPVFHLSIGLVSPMTAFDAPFATLDPEIHAPIRAEEVRETDKIRLIASENYVSRAVLEATGSILTNKYSEGYAGKRYYEGQQIIDQVEQLAISRMKELFGAEHVNVQPYSGSPANLAVYLAFCQPHDPILGLSLPAGGHLTHGWKVSITGKYFKSFGYGVTEDTHLIDFDEVRRLAKEHKPKLLWCGTSAYPRTLDFAKFREIADEVGAVLVADIAHIAG